MVIAIRFSDQYVASKQHQSEACGRRKSLPNNLTSIYDSGRVKIGIIQPFLIASRCRHLVKLVDHIAHCLLDPPLDLKRIQT